MVDTIKFSQMNNGGDLAPGDSTPGLLNHANALFSNPWTFLAPGTTGDRPIPAPAMYYRLRLNTTLEIYEYYDPTIPLWVELSGSGTGTVNPGVANDIAYYAASGQAVSPIGGAINSVLVTNGAKVPSLSTTLPSGLTIPGATITGSTAALLSGSVVAAPSSGNDLTNKTYVDSLVGSSVVSITGTTNQVIASSPTGNVTLSLPQDIALGSTPTFAGLTLSSIPLNSASGGTGINNGASTITLGGSLATIGAFVSNFTMTGDTNVTFPTTGTLATTAGTVSSVSGTTNRITSTGGTTPVIDIAATYVGQSSITTLGTITTGVWNGTVVSPTYGGTGVNNGASTITIGGNFSMIGAFTFAGTLTGNTAVTFPTSGTLLTSAGAVTSLIATANQTTVSAATGNVTIGIASNAILPGTGGVTLPQGNTAARAGGAGTIRFNTQSAVFESTVDGSTWAIIDTSASGDVDSIIGTANQVIVSNPTGNVTLSLPQNIATTSTPIFAGFNDSNSNRILDFTPVASAVNNITIANSAAGVGAPSISVAGSDTNIILGLISKGTGAIQLISKNTTIPFIWSSGTTARHSTSWAISDTAQSRTITIPDATGTMLMTGQAISTVPSISFGQTALNYYEEGTWTPADNSGAALTFTGVTATYTRIGRMVVALCTLAYPVTANGANASISGLPYTASSSAGAVGGQIVYTTATTLSRALVGASTKVFSLYTSAGVFIVNSAMSNTTNYFMLTYFV